MKKQAILLASFGVLSSAAYAQSSVTLYGIVDVGVLYVNNAVSGGKGGQQWSLASSNLQGSRLGLRGTEDLGGGLSALFVLENGFTTNNGKLAQGGDLFGRQAFVGLSSQKFGMLTLGRQYDSSSTTQVSSRLERNGDHTMAPILAISITCLIRCA